MSDPQQAFAQALVKSLVGERGHLPIARAVSDITYELAGTRVNGSPYTIYQLLSHMDYWQQFLLSYLGGIKPEMPGHVMDSWPEAEAPANESQLKDLIWNFLHGIDKAVQYAEKVQLDEPLTHFPTETAAGILRNIASHNSYHLGEIVLLRRLCGAWPPPGGGYPA